MNFSFSTALTVIRENLIKIEGVIAAASLFLLLLMVLVEVLARNLFDTGFPGMEMVTRYLVLFVGLMGAVLATERVCHIKCDVISAFVSPQTRVRIMRPLFVLSALICAALCWYAARFWWDEWQYAGSHEKWSVPLALILPVGFALLAFHMLLTGLMGSHASEEDRRP
jgi:TRAP-type C4-dicarboxylate transport system permease small subunit